MSNEWELDKRTNSDRRAADRRSGIDTRSDEEKRLLGERRSGERRSGADRRAREPQAS